MTTHDDSRRAIAAWLDDMAPARAPTRLIETSRERVRGTPQRRRWWPVPMRSNANLVGGVGVAIASIAAISVVGLMVFRPSVGPAASSSATAALPSPTAASGSPSRAHSAAPGEATFTSTIHGISIDYPAGWQTRPATEAWTGGELGFDSPAADVIYDPAVGDRVYLIVASQRYGSQSGDAWRNSVLAWTCASGAHEGWGWTVDGFSSWQQGPCNSGSIVQTDRRGYLIRVVVSSDDPALAQTYGWDWLKPILQTVDLRPDEAVDGPVPSTSG